MSNLFEDLGVDYIAEITAATESFCEDLRSLELSTGITRVIRAKVNRGEDLTDEEIYIATESIGSSFLASSSIGFEGFGLESYAGKGLSQAEKTRVVVTAIEDAGKEKAKEAIKKAKDIAGWWDKYKASFKGSTGALRKNAADLIRALQETPDEYFKNERIKNSDVSLAVQRGENVEPFDNYKDVLKGVAKLTDSLDVIARSAKYDSLGGWFEKNNLSGLAEKMHGVRQEVGEGKASYDLNPDRITGYRLSMTVPTNTNSNYFMRNLKANFVIKAKSSGRLGKSQGITVQGLSKSEAIGLLKAVITHIGEQEDLFMANYKNVQVSLWEGIKGITKSLISGIAGINSAILRDRMMQLSLALFHINYDALRGLITWAGKSVTK